MDTCEDTLDKVRMSEEESYKLDHCFGSYGLPSFMDVDSYMTAAISIEEALYKLSKYGNYYKVKCAIEEFKDGEVMSFYLVNESYPQECHWIVYDKPHYDYPSQTVSITIEEALYKLSHFGFYIVADVIEDFKGYKVKSFYLFNNLYPIERYWIVYNKSNN